MLSYRGFGVLGFWGFGVAAMKPAGAYKGGARRYDAEGAIVAPGLVDPHIHIESAMITACAYAEAALISGVTTSSATATRSAT